MTVYARLRSRLPKRLVDWLFVAVQTGLLVALVLYSDKPPAAFPYLRL